MIETNGDPATRTVALSGEGTQGEGLPDDVVLPQGVEKGVSVVVEACRSVTAADYRIQAPGAVSFRAPIVSLADGFSVGVGTSFDAGRRD